MKFYLKLAILFKISCSIYFYILEVKFMKISRILIDYDSGIVNEIVHQPGVSLKESTNELKNL